MNTILLFLCLGGAIITIAINEFSSLSQYPIISSFCISFMAAYVFYLFQSLIPNLIKQNKYKEFIYSKFCDIEQNMKRVLSLMSGMSEMRVEDVEDITEKIFSYLTAESDLFEAGACVYRNREELVLIDAIYEFIESVHIQIIELITMDILDKKHINMVADIEKCNLRKTIQNMYRDKEGELMTVQQKKGRSFGGSMVYLEAAYRDLAKEGEEYRKALCKLIKSRKTIYK